MRYERDPITTGATATLTTTLGASPWSSTYGRRLEFQRSWVRILVLFTEWKYHFSHIFVVRIIMFFFEKTENKWKRGRGWPIFLKKNTPSSMEGMNNCDVVNVNITLKVP